MTALAIEQLHKYQTSPAVSSFNRGPSVKFNLGAKRITPISENIVLRRNNAPMRLVDLTTAQTYLGTIIDSEKETLSLPDNTAEICVTQGTGSLDFWLSETKLSDYWMLVDNYDVAAVEENHMQCASKYGW